MKNSELNRKNVGAAGIASKACAWILSIMLVVTGMAPSFAANAKSGNGSAAATTKATSETKVATKDKITSKAKTPNKSTAFQKDVSSSSKNKKLLKTKMIRMVRKSLGINECQ